MKKLETKDITLAAMLLSKGIECETIIKVGNVGTFIYQLDEDQMAHLLDYAVNEAWVEPKEFHAAIRSLSKRIKNTPVKK